MTLSKSRKAICFILTLLIAAGSILLFGISITKSTVLSQKYMDYVFFLYSFSDFALCNSYSYDPQFPILGSITLYNISTRKLIRITSIAIPIITASTTG